MNFNFFVSSIEDFENQLSENDELRSSYDLLCKANPKFKSEFLGVLAKHEFPKYYITMSGENTGKATNSRVEIMAFDDPRFAIDTIDSLGRYICHYSSSGTFIPYSQYENKDPNENYDILVHYNGSLVNYDNNGIPVNDATFSQDIRARGGNRATIRLHSSMLTERKNLVVNVQDPGMPLHVSSNKAIKVHNIGNGYDYINSFEYDILGRSYGAEFNPFDLNALRSTSISIDKFSGTSHPFDESKCNGSFESVRSLNELKGEQSGTYELKQESSLGYGTAYVASADARVK